MSEPILDERTAKSIEQSILFWNGSGFITLTYYAESGYLQVDFQIQPALKDYYLEQFRSVARWPVAYFPAASSFTVFFKLNGKERAAATMYPAIVKQKQSGVEFDFFANAWREI